MATSVTFDLFARDHASGAFVKVGQAAQRAGREVDGLGRRASLLGGHFTAVSRVGPRSFGLLATGAKAAGLALGAAAVSAGVFGLKTASNMEQARISFETMLGSASKADVFLRQLQKFAASTPFEFPELQTAASSLISAGINANKVIPIMRTLGDVTSGMGTGSEGVRRATIALQQMSAAGRITGEDLNQLRDAGVPVFDLLAAATGKSKAEVVKLAQAGKLGSRELGQLMKALETGKGLERFNGLMEKQSQSLAGLFSTLKDNVSMSLANLVTPAIPAIKAGLTWMTTATAAVGPRIQAAFAAIGGAIAGVFNILVRGDFTHAFAQAFHVAEDSPVVDVLFRIRSAVQTVALGMRAMVAAFREGDVTSDGFVGVMERVGNALRAVSKFVSEHRDLLFTMAKGVAAVTAAFVAFRVVMLGVNLVLSINPIGVVIVALGALVGAIVYAYQHSERFRAVVATVWAMVKQVGAFLARTFTPTFQALGQTIQRNVIPPLIQLWAAVQRNMPAFIAFAKFIGGVIVVVGALAAKILGFLLPILLRLAGFLVGRLFGLITRTIQYFGNLVRAVQSAWGTFRAFLAIVSEVWQRFISATSTAIGRAVALITGIRGRILGVITGAATWLVRIGSDIIGGLWAGFRNAMRNVGAVLGNVKDAIIGGLKRLFGINSPSTVMAGIGGHMITGLIKGLLTQSGALARVVKSIGGNVAGIFGGIDLGLGHGSTASGPMQKMVQGYANILYGWNGAQWDALRSLIMGESGFNPNAQNPTSSAYGLFQFLDSTWAGVNASKTSDPQAQTLAGLRYIKQRYGTPANAYGSWLSRSPHWYGSGMSPTVFRRPTLIGVGESGAETVSVVPHSRAATAATVAGTTIVVNLTTVGSLDAAATNKIRTAIREALRAEGRPAVV